MISTAAPQAKDQAADVNTTPLRKRMAEMRPAMLWMACSGVLRLPPRDARYNPLGIHGECIRKMVLP